MRFTVLRTALASISKHRMRAGLTILGISIGIAAVICTAALGQGSADRVRAQIDLLGEDFLWIRPGSLNLGGARSGWGGARTLTADDARALQDQVASIQLCSPVSQGREQLIANGDNWNTRYQGVLPGYFDIRRRTFRAGAAFGEFDERSGARVMVLGSGVADRLFPGMNPIGQDVRVNRFVFRVIGVLDPRGSERGGVDRDDVAFVPFTTANRSFDRRDWVADVMCSVTGSDRMDQAITEATALLRYRHGLVGGEDDDFQIQKPMEVIEMRAQTSRTLAWLLLAMGTVSLVVAGVGIMNIMLVAVSERRQEIGVRLAIGARIRDIRWQFLAEAAALGLAGGALGVLVGICGSWLLSQTSDVSARVSGEVALWTTVAALMIGVVFGYYPAHRASGLDPIEAIRGDGD